MAEATKVLIVDDEDIARKVLAEELQLHADIEVVGMVGNGVDAIQAITEKKPDIVFLDLQMPVMGGFEVIRKITNPPLPVFVILTAFDRYAVQAFENGAVDYLLKPVSEERLALALERARSLVVRPQQNAEKLSEFSNLALAELSTPSRSPKVVGRSGEEFYLLDASEVLAFQAEGELVWIVTARGKYLATQSLRAIETRLRHLPFQRVHRNAIVNVDHVRKMSGLSSQRWLITLSNSSQLIVSKRQAHSVKHILRW